MVMIFRSTVSIVHASVFAIILTLICMVPIALILGEPVNVWVVVALWLLFCLAIVSKP